MPAPDIVFRLATRADLPAVVGLLADDPLGTGRESAAEPLDPGYLQAFDAIDRDPHNELVIADDGARVVGVLQLTFIPSITYRGGWRALIEGVRVASGRRSAGVGRAMFEWAIARAQERGCHLLQLTSDKARPEAIRFYEQLGFVASHEGLKLRLPAPARPAHRGG